MTDASDFRPTGPGADVAASGLSRADLSSADFGGTAGYSADLCSTEADGLLGRSVMKWGADGELSALDLQHILSRLSCVDEQAAGLMDCPVDLG